jgi:DNA polymerase III alpha subunit
MFIDDYGQKVYSSEDICQLLYKNPNLNFSKFQIEDPDQYNNSIKSLHAELDIVEKYHKFTDSVVEFDDKHQSDWFMPDEYKNLDIAKWVLDRCKTQEELQRVGEELLLFQEKNLFMLLRYLKYLVDVMRKENIVWGVGRGSSTASYVLYLIGIHKINSLYYEIPITDFLK